MAAEIQPSQATPTLPSKRKSKPRNSKKSYKKPKPSVKKSQKPTQKMQKLYRKRAKDYHSDEEEVPEEAHTEPAAAGSPEDQATSSGSDGEAAVDTDAQSDNELEEDGPHQGITKLAEGSRTFKLTFSKIIKEKLPNEPLCCRRVGAQESGCVAEKLVEEAMEHKVKAETKKLKQYNLFADKKTGSYNFDGRYDLVRFIKTVQNAGLYSHIHIGPYVCVEWNFGGFPVWLKYVPGISFITDNEPFKAAMQGFTEKIVRMMKSARSYESFRLKSCEPEFLVSTPEKLLELVSVGAIGISGPSLLLWMHVFFA